jgi:predicted MFS family arabinose efflux permease
MSPESARFKGLRVVELATAGFAAVGWRQVVASAMLLGVMGIMTAGYGMFSVPLAQEFKPSRMLLMLAITVMSIVTAILSPILGNMMDRVSLKRLMALGAVSVTTGFVALSFTTSIYQVLIVYGLFMAPVNVLMGPIIVTVLLSRWFVNRRGRAIGMAVTGMSVVSLCLPPFIQWLLDNNDWRVAFRLLALSFCLFTTLAIVMIVENPAKKGMYPDGGNAPTEAERERQRQEAAPIGIRAILTDPAFWIIGAIFALILAGMKGMITNLVPMAIDVGIKPSSAALLMSIFSASGITSKLIFSMVADKISHRYLLAGAIAGFVTGLVCLTRAESGFWVIAAGVSLIAMFGGLSTPLQGILVPRIFGQRVIGRVSGLLSLVMLALALSSPPAFGLIYDRTGSYDAMFFVLAAISAATILLVPYLRMHPKVVDASETAMAEAPLRPASTKV